MFLFSSKCSSSFDSLIIFLFFRDEQNFSIDHVQITKLFQVDTSDSLEFVVPPQLSPTLPTSQSRVFECSKCDASFNSNRGMQVHIRRVHNVCPPDRFKFECCFCSKGFHLKKDYHDHLTHQHGQVVPKRHMFQLCACSDCGKMFNNRRALRIHVRGVHTSEETYQCDPCGKTYNTSKYLNVFPSFYID